MGRRDTPTLIGRGNKGERREEEEEEGGREEDTVDSRTKRMQNKRRRAKDNREPMNSKQDRTIQPLRKQIRESQKIPS